MSYEQKQAAAEALRTYRGTNELPGALSQLTNTGDSGGHGLRSGASGRPFLTKSRKAIAADACRGIPPPDLTVWRTS